MNQRSRCLAAITLALALSAPCLQAQALDETAKRLIDQSLSTFDLAPFEWSGAPDVLRPRLGLYTNEIPADSLRFFHGIPAGAKPVRVWHVMPHWSADDAGMLIGDLIITMNGRPIGDSVYQFDDYLNVTARDMRPGDTAWFSIVRGGTQRTLPVPLRAPVRVAMPCPPAPEALGVVRSGTWLAGAIASHGLQERATTIQKQMRIIADQDFCTVPFAGRANPWRLGAVTYLHHNPTRVGAYSRWVVNQFWAPWERGYASAVIRTAAMRLDLPVAAPASPLPRAASRADLDALLREVRTRLERAYAPVRGNLDSMTVQLARLLDPEHSWEEALDSTSDPVRKRALRIANEGTMAGLLGKADKVDLAQVVDASAHLAELADSDALVGLADALEHAAGKATAHVEGVEGDVLLTWESPAGRCVVGGRGANHYTGHFAVIIDLGGADVYDLPPIPMGGCRFVGDLGGNDIYRSTTTGQAAGIGGVDILADLSGDDIYRSSYYSQGSGLLGVGLLADYAGDDVYQSHWCSQGAAFHGIGIIMEGGGSDRYDADVYSQAFAYVHGCGVILERGGNDSYRAGWKYPDSRIPNRAHLAMSQGFGFGMRPWSTGIGADGGIGVLSDLDGDDLYASDFFSQGGSYWYALGILHDARGADRYTAGQYSQGSGIHLSFGALLDDAGDDMYDAYAGLEQGNAHDWSAGCLEDAAGNDTYRGSNSSQGSALTVSFAWLLDAAGDDKYYAMLSDSSQSQGGGNANRVRRSGSLGMLIDRGQGDDFYVEPRVVPGDVLLKANGMVFDDGRPPRP